jgi:ABC-type phosphate transport system substrate-binding protein
MMPWKRNLSLICLLVLSWLPVQAKQMAVVVDKANNMPNITAADLAKIFQTNTKKWPDGRNITIVLADLSSGDLQQALQHLFKMTPEEVRAFVAAHKGSFVVVESPDALLKLVQSTPGAVGLLDVYAITRAVNVVKVDGKLPLEPGYLFH